ncbi:MAG: hypothetical protein ACOYK8_04675 [Alphaproteobacteria bacterium]
MADQNNMHGAGKVVVDYDLAQYRGLKPSAAGNVAEEASFFAGEGRIKKSSRASVYDQRPALSRGQLQMLLWMAFFFIAVVMGSLWLMHAPFSPDNLENWAAAIITRDNMDSFRARFAVQVSPLPFWIHYFLQSFPGLGNVPSSWLAATIVHSLLLMQWYGLLKKTKVGQFYSVAFALLAGLNPMVLWAIWQGTGCALLLFFFTWAARAAFLVRQLPNERSVMGFAVALCGMCLSHPLGYYILFGMIPFLSWLAAPQMLARSIRGYLSIILFPSMLSLGAVVYLHWLFLGDGLIFIRDAQGPFAGAMRTLQQSIWAMRNQGKIIEPMAFFFVASVFITPALSRAFWLSRARLLRLVPAAVMMMGIIAGGTLASSLAYLDHPATILCLYISLLAAFTATGDRPPPEPQRLLGLMSVGWFVGLFILFVFPSKNTADFLSAIIGRESEERLVQNRLMAFSSHFKDCDTVLVDEEGASILIDGYGDGKKLMPGASPGFSRSVLSRRPEGDCILVPHPGSSAGKKDRLNHAWPNLYKDGINGYFLVGEQDDWRLYQRYGMLRKNQKIQLLPTYTPNSATPETGKLEKATPTIVKPEEIKPETVKNVKPLSVEEKKLD